MSDEVNEAPETELMKMQKECFDRLRAIVDDYEARTPDVVSAVLAMAQLVQQYGWGP